MDRNLVERTGSPCSGGCDGSRHESTITERRHRVFELIQLTAGRRKKSGRCRKILSSGEKIGAIVQQFPDMRARTFHPRNRSSPGGSFRDPPLLTVRPRRNNVTILPPPKFLRASFTPTGGYRSGAPRTSVQRRGAMSGTGGSFRRDSPGRRRLGIHRERPGTGIPRDSRRGSSKSDSPPHGTVPCRNGTPGRAAPRGAGGGNAEAFERPRGGCVATVRLPMRPRI